MWFICVFTADFQFNLMKTNSWANSAPFWMLSLKKPCKCDGDGAGEKIAFETFKCPLINNKYLGEYTSAAIFCRFDVCEIRSVQANARRMMQKDILQKKKEMRCSWMQICFAVWTYLTKGVEIMRYLFFVWAIGPMIVRFIWSIRFCFANGFIFTRIYFVMRMVFFLSHHQFSLHFVRNVVTKYENFRIKLQVEQQIWQKKRKQYINTAFTFDSCKLLVLSHRISCILYYECYECITFFQQITHCDDLFLCYWWCALDCVSECSWCKRKQIRFVDIDSKKRKTQHWTNFPNEKKWDKENAGF